MYSSLRDFFSNTQCLVLYPVSRCQVRDRFILPQALTFSSLFFACLFIIGVVLILLKQFYIQPHHFYCIVALLFHLLGIFCKPLCLCSCKWSYLSWKDYCISFSIIAVVSKLYQKILLSFMSHPHYQRTCTSI